MEIESQITKQVAREIHVRHVNIHHDLTSVALFFRKQVIDGEENELKWKADQFGPYLLQINQAKTLDILRILEPSDMIEELHRIRRAIRDGEAGDEWEVAGGVATQLAK